jgi:hypothetical protein
MGYVKILNLIIFSWFEVKSGGGNARILDDFEVIVVNFYQFSSKFEIFETCAIFRENIKLFPKYDARQNFLNFYYQICIKI